MIYFLIKMTSNGASTAVLGNVRQDQLRGELISTFISLL